MTAENPKSQIQNPKNAELVLGFGDWDFGFTPLYHHPSQSLHPLRDWRVSAE
jgi:hypothetical protein